MATVTVNGRAQAAGPGETVESLLDRLDEVRGLEQRLMRAGIEPRHAAPEHLHFEFAATEVVEVHVGDLQLPAR